MSYEGALLTGPLQVSDEPMSRPSNDTGPEGSGLRLTGAAETAGSIVRKKLELPCVDVPCGPRPRPVATAKSIFAARDVNNEHISACFVCRWNANDRCYLRDCSNSSARCWPLNSKLYRWTKEQWRLTRDIWFVCVVY